MAARPPLTPGERRLRTAHRYLGLVGACVLVGLVLTGIPLQHADTFGLDQRHVASATVAHWLGIEAPEPIAYRVQDATLSLTGDLLALDGRPLDTSVGTLIGAAAVGDLVAAASVESLVLLTRDGRLVDRIDLPARALRLGVAAQGPVVETTAGAFRMDAALTAWERADDVDDTNWSSPVALEPAAADALRARYLERAVTWSRALRELHSGRAFGTYGPLVVDAAALLVLVLAATGLWIARQR